MCIKLYSVNIGHTHSANIKVLSVLVVESHIYIVLNIYVNLTREFHKHTATIAKKRKRKKKKEKKKEKLTVMLLTKSTLNEAAGVIQGSGDQSIIITNSEHSSSTL